MNQYLICETGYGDGCDYTIGCNQRWRIEDFDGNLEEATEYFTNGLIINDEEDYYIEKAYFQNFQLREVLLKCLWFHWISMLCQIWMDYGRSMLKVYLIKLIKTIKSNKIKLIELNLRD